MEKDNFLLIIVALVAIVGIVAIVFVTGGQKVAKIAAPQLSTQNLKGSAAYDCSEGWTPYMTNSGDIWCTKIFGDGVSTCIAGGSTCYWCSGNGCVLAQE